MEKKEIQAKLRQIADTINYKTAILYKQDIDNVANGCDCICGFMFFPRINSGSRAVLKQISEKTFNTADELVTGFEHQQIDKLSDFCQRGINKSTDNKEALNILKAAYAELVQLALDLLPEDQRKVMLELSLKQIAYNQLGSKHTETTPLLNSTVPSPKLS